MKKQLKAYSWGYWGWSTEIEHFLEAAEAHEASEGFASPAFADVRIKRSGRAKTFVNNSFEKVVGEERYRWFPGLGNPKVATHEDGLAVEKPEEVQSLLKFIEDQAKAKRRVLFFCACQYIERDGEPCCHRRLVADLLLEAARKANKSLEVEEWPGGEPQAIEIEEDSMPRYGVYYPLGSDMPEAGATTLPVGSTVQVAVGDELLDAFGTGPAEFRKGQWWLPIYRWPIEEGKDILESISTEANSMRKSLGTLPRTSNASSSRSIGSLPMQDLNSIEALLGVIRNLLADQPVHNPRKWYLTQKEHWIGWLSDYSGPGAYGRQTVVTRDAKYAYNHIVQPEMLIYLAEASGVDRKLVKAAKQAFDKGTTLMQKSGAIRGIIPWETVATALWPNS